MTFAYCPENYFKKLHLIIVLTITFDPQRIFKWGLFHWKVDILGFNLNVYSIIWIYIE